MTKSQRFLLAVSKLQITPPENIEAILKWINRNQKITFFSWKMFDIKIKNEKLYSNPNFDSKISDKFIDNEKWFLKTLIDLQINFDYLKVVPDELLEYFFGKSNKTEADRFVQQIDSYFRKIYPPTQTFLLTDILKKYNLASDYQSIFANVYKNIGKLVNQKEMDKEILFRSTYYSSQPIQTKIARELAKRAFALFAAETNSLFKLQQKKVFRNLVLLSKLGSTNTYKYEFFKYPKNRSTLPKLFVI